MRFGSSATTIIGWNISPLGLNISPLGLNISPLGLNIFPWLELNIRYLLD